MCVLRNLCVAQRLDSSEIESKSAQNNVLVTANTQWNWDTFPFHSVYTTTNPDINFNIRNINTATDKYTGIINIKIPIFNIELSSEILPIYLSYCTSGIRADDLSSIVGLGWRLFAGGKISRAVRGEPDNFEQLAKTTTDISKWTEENHLKWYSEEWDTQPDLYYFEFPGTSGCFVFDAQKKAHSIPYQHVKIDFDEINNQFKIYDKNGTCYYFGTTESTWELFPINPGVETKECRKYTSVWYLDKIEFLNGDIVSFAYITGTQLSHKNNHRIVQLDYVPGSTKSLPMGSFDVAPTIINPGPKYLDRITYREQQIDFLYDSSGGDRQNMKKLNTITVSKITPSTNKLITRNIEFTYGTFKGSQRLKLTGVQERADESLIKPICSFEYYENIDAPARDSWAIDHWGFYNGPTERFSYYPDIQMVSEFDPNVIAPAFYIASRKPNLEYTRVQSLKKILYPNGGYKEFEYELHKGLNPQTRQMENAGGLRIQKITENDGISSTTSAYSYTYKDGRIYDESPYYILSCSKAISAKETRYTFYLSNRNLSNSADYFGATVVYSSVVETLPNKSSIKYEYIPLNDYKDLPGQLYLQSSNYATVVGVELKGRTPKTSLAWGRNLLRKRIIFDATGDEVASESFIYKADSTNMVCIPGYTMYYTLQKESGRPYVEHYLGEYYSVSCPLMLEQQITYKGKYTPSSKTMFLYKSNYLLSSVSKIEGDRTSTTKEYTFPQDYNICDTTSVIGKLTSRNAIIPLEEITYSNGKIIAAQGRSFRFNEANPHAIVLDCERSLRKAIPIDPGSFIPVKCTTTGITFNNLYQLDNSYLEYNSSGQLLCYSDECGIEHSFLYKENTTRPYVTFHNARYSINPAYNEVYFNDFEDQVGPPCSTAKSGSQVFFASPNTSYLIDKKLKAGDYNVVFWHDDANIILPWKRHVTPLKITSFATAPSVKLGVVAQIDDLCILPCNATFSISEYVPGWGNVSETTEQGSYFKTEYNGFGFPVKITDHRNVVIKKYDYK